MDDDRAQPLSVAGKPSTYAAQKVLKTHSLHLGDIVRMAQTSFEGRKSDRTTPLRAECVPGVPSGGRTFVRRLHNGGLSLTIEGDDGQRVYLLGHELEAILAKAWDMLDELKR